jgi:hypothetical protein
MCALFLYGFIGGRSKGADDGKLKKCWQCVYGDGNFKIFIYMDYKFLHNS